jgi:hypothetical protein
MCVCVCVCWRRCFHSGVGLFPQQRHLAGSQARKGRLADDDAGQPQQVLCVEPISAAIVTSRAALLLLFQLGSTCC